MAKNYEWDKRSKKMVSVDKPEVLGESSLDLEKELAAVKKENKALVAQVAELQQLAGANSPGKLDPAPAQG